MMNFTLTESDFRSNLDGYHMDVWVELCDTFDLDPDTTDCIEVKYLCHHDKPEA